jgi:hypothetical protein
VITNLKLNDRARRGEVGGIHESKLHPEHLILGGGDVFELDGVAARSGHHGVG